MNESKFNVIANIIAIYPERISANATTPAISFCTEDKIEKSA